MPVFLDYDQARLDLNYNQGAWAPNADTIIAWYRQASLAAHARLQPIGLSYGPGPLERIDLFRTAASGGPVVIYVHGGAWRSLDRMDSAFAAQVFVEAGINFAVLDFAGIPAVRLPEMVTQVQRGMAWLAANAAAYDIDAGRLFAVGHSSGAHLVAAALTAATECRLPRKAVKGAVCASGAYDLEAPMLSARGAYLRLSPEEVATFSPLRHLAAIDCPIVIAYGEGETDEYRRHARTFHAALIEAGKASEIMLLPSRNHFEVSVALAQRDSALFGAIADLSQPTG
jgi:arylformamidase